MALPRKLCGAFKETTVRRLSAVLCFISLAALCVPLHSQTVDTAILGTVSDSSGAVIPGATVTVSSAATGERKSTVTTAAGEYTINYLIPGNYVLTVSANGFTTYQQKDIALQINQQARIQLWCFRSAATPDSPGAGHPAPAPDRGRLSWRRCGAGERRKPSAQRP